MAFLKNSLTFWLRNVRMFGREAVAAEQLKMVPNSINKSENTRLLKQYFKHVSKNQNYSLVRLLNENKMSITSTEISQVRKEFLESKEYRIPESIIDKLVVELCKHKKRIDIAISYLQEVWKNPDQVKISSKIMYLDLCYYKKQLTETEMKILLEIYDTIRKEYPVFNESIGYSLIAGISVTDRWKESLELYDTLKMFCDPKYFCIIAITHAAFDNNEPEIGWEFLKKVHNLQGIPNKIYFQYLDHFKKRFKGEQLEAQIEKLFQFWSDGDILPCLTVVNACAEILKHLGWNVNEAYINSKGICNICSNRFDHFTISNEDCQKLAKLIRDRIVIGVDIYRRSSPKEWDEYVQFIEDKGPFDIVIDGLNISYKSKSNVKHLADRYMISRVLDNLTHLNKKILVLGRQHMLQWHIPIESLKAKADVFLLHDKNSDDSYMLYAALSSGPDAMFMTRDLLRDHKFVLSDKDMEQKFQRWQRTHQIIPVPTIDSVGTRIYLLKKPSLHLPIVQKTSNAWHIPYSEYEYKQNYNLNPGSITSWVCLQKDKK